MSKSVSDSSARHLGRVKWFNNKAGFGFVTVLEGEKKDEDIFVHHTGVIVNDEQYKYLVQGEYVSFSLTESDNNDHPYQAGNVRGVGDGLLMCETRNANRQNRENEDDDGSTRKPRRRVRPRGSGPRGNNGPRDTSWNLKQNNSSVDDQGTSQ